MRTLFTLAVLALGVGAATAAAAAPVSVDFDNLQIGAVDGSLSDPAASFASNTGVLYVGAAGGDRALCPLNGSNCVATLTVSFAGPVYNLTFQADGDNSAASSLFVSGVAAAGAFSFTGGGFDGLIHTYNSFDLSAYSGITSIAITNNDRAGLGYNHFSFDTVALEVPGGDAGGVVPEPATWALMLAGFGLVGSAMRRRVRAVVAA